MTKTKFILLLFLVPLLVSCQTQPPSTPNIVNTIPEAKQTITPTLEITQLSIIVTALQLPTNTPVATLPVITRQESLIELFSNNGSCAFPCWWGIGPGDSIRELSDLAILIGETPLVSGSYYSFNFPLGELNTSDFAMSFQIDKFEKVTGIEVFLNQPSRFRDYYDAFERQLSPTSILAHYGMPSETLLLVTPRFEPGDGLRSYTLFMIYDDQDFGIKYWSTVSAETPLKICPIKMNDHYLQSVELYLNDPRSKIGQINRFNSAELKPIDSVTSMRLNEIYRVLSSSNNECLIITVDPWQ